MADPGKPYYEETWFELLFLSGCFVAAYFLFQLLMPAVNMGSETIQTVAMAKLLSEGRLLDAFSRFNQPPVYPMLLAMVIKLEHTIDLPRLVTSFRGLNLCLFFSSILMVYYFIRRLIPKPYSFAITALYALAPGTLNMAWAIDAQMTYMVLSMASLVAVDYSLSKESAEGGLISRGELVMIGILIAGSILTQQVGYMLLIAFFFIMLKRFGLKRSALVLGVMFLLMSPFIGRDIFYVVRRPQQYVAPSASLVQTVTHRGIIKAVEAYADNFVFNLTHHAVGDLNLTSLDRTVHTSEHPTVSRIAITQQPWGRWALGLLAIIGVLYGLYQYTGVGSLYLCAYLITAIILLPNTRMTLSPVLPLILFYLYFGVMRAGEWMKRLHLPVSRIAGPVLTAWILLCSFTAHLAQWSEAKPYGRGMFNHEPQIVYMSTDKAPENRLEEAQNISAHHRAMDWLEAHSPQSARVAIPRPEAASMMAEGKQGGVNKTEQTQIRKELGNYDFLVEESAAKLSPMRTHPGEINNNGLKLVYEDAPGRIRIWQIKPAMQ